MPKMSTELTRFALHGSTMGTRWSALFFADLGFGPDPIRAALQAASVLGQRFSPRVDGFTGQ